jgi:hypothetical protein
MAELIMTGFAVLPSLLAVWLGWALYGTSAKTE